MYFMSVCIETELSAVDVHECVYACIHECKNSFIHECMCSKLSHQQ